MEATRELKNEDFYKIALRETEQYNKLSESRRQFLEAFLILFIHHDFVRDKNKNFAETYNCAEKTVERYFCDLRLAKIIEQKISAPMVDGKYMTSRIMWMNSLLKAKIQARAKELKEEYKKCSGGSL